MNPVAVMLLSASMSVDAFAVAVGRGATVSRTRISEAVRTGLIFGAVEALTPLLGWLAGIAANDWVANFDHWIAFGLLGAVGLHMIYGALFGTGEEEADGDAPRRASLVVLLATAFGTSLDAMAVGLSLAFIDVDLMGILAVSLGVGITTFAFAMVGMLLGKAIGNRFGKIAEVLAGLVLCVIGSMILFEHLAG